ncbi:hypothetical protein [Marinifilum caeruleilacunae]|uniref:Uncharacterized protein n=1 Tax=Marinifilum caeruleilacunae TaxID=2499076 RepID=A0ABX1WT68_9BACT|nr:hypothetical protein [Marinifilum caeruleilacunae]NOU59305.1 hypothetical protein [Marinifilum caeruleilacunae]
MINVEYKSDKDILDVVMTGRIQFAQMKEYCLNLLKDLTTPKHIRILEDASQAELLYDIDDAERLGTILEAELDHRFIVSHALIRRNPLDTAYGIIRMKTNTNDRYHLKVFSTAENGRDWLLRE